MRPIPQNLVAQSILRTHKPSGSSRKLLSTQACNKTGKHLVVFRILDLSIRNRHHVYPHPTEGDLPIGIIQGRMCRRMKSLALALDCERTTPNTPRMVEV